MTEQEAIAYIDSYYTNVTAPGLHRIRAFTDALGRPQDGLKFVHVAGTNGKGSTCAMLASVLRAAGYKTGLFTSPHIHRFEERMQINGEPIPGETLAALVAELRVAAENMSEKLHQFELTTGIALTWFAREKCDIVVLEVGLGGEFDATNVIETPECAVIANIGYDHTAILGDTLSEIAEAKAGIIKSGGDVVFYPAEPEVEAVLRETAERVGARLHAADFSAIRLREEDLTGQSFDAAGWEALRLPLLGAYQRRNAAVALTACRVLAEKGWKIDESAIRRGLETVRWPARLEVAVRKPLFLVDGGHNPQCLSALTESLTELVGNKKIVFLVGVLQDKDAEGMISLLSPCAEAFVAVTPDSPRAIPAAALAGLLKKSGRPVHASDSIEQGIRTAISLAGENGVICCAGSLYLTGDVLSLVSQFLPTA